jgi:Zn finger protein HypA/HybF involved in hydrogenase expression
MKASNAALTPEQRRKRFHTEAKRRHYETHVLAMQIINRTRIELMTTQEMKSSDARRRRVLHQQDGKCKRCGLDEWRGEPLTLELEHKDGNRDNNRRENLECLCPNCHSLTLTWRGRKNQGRIGMTKPIPVEGHPSISAYQRTQGRTPKGAAFARIRKKLASGELKP